MFTTTTAPEPIAFLLEGWDLVMFYREHISALCQQVNPAFHLAISYEQSCTILWDTFSYELPPFKLPDCDAISKQLWCEGHYDGFCMLPHDPVATVKQLYKNGYEMGYAQVQGEQLVPPDPALFNPVLTTASS
jgi:hypothetical protein